MFDSLTAVALACVATLFFIGAAFAAESAANSTPANGCIAAALQPFVDRHALAGAVTLVATKDKVLSVDAVGFADVAAKTPMRADSLFWVASQSKPITTTALMMLVDEGKVNVEDPIENYIPEFKDLVVAGPEKGATHKPSRAVTLRDLLTHTSGMGFSSPKESPTLDMLPLRDAVLSHAAVPLHSEPGTKYQYSNAGINTIGLVIQLVSGMPYEQFLQKRIFDPLGMKDTSFVPTEEQVQRLAKSYRPNKEKSDLEECRIGQLKYPLTDRSRCPMPAGGLFSTAQDMGRFCQMILNGGEFDGKRYVSEVSVKLMTTRQTPATIKDWYGFGWAVGRDWCGHGGAHATNMTIDTKNGLVLVYLVQHAGFPLDGDKSLEAFKRAAVKLAGK